MKSWLFWECCMLKLMMFFTAKSTLIDIDPQALEKFLTTLVTSKGFSSLFTQLYCNYANEQPLWAYHLFQKTIDKTCNPAQFFWTKKGKLLVSPYFYPKQSVPPTSSFFSPISWTYKSQLEKIFLSLTKDLLSPDWICTGRIKSFQFWVGRRSGTKRWEVNWLPDSSLAGLFILLVFPVSELLIQGWNMAQRVISQQKKQLRKKLPLWSLEKLEKRTIPDLTNHG